MQVIQLNMFNKEPIMAKTPELNSNQKLQLINMSQSEDYGNKHSKSSDRDHEQSCQ